VGDHRDSEHHTRDEPRPALTASMPRAIMIMAMPPTAVNTAADCATPMGRIACTACRRLRSGGETVTMTLMSPSRKKQSAGQRGSCAVVVARPTVRPSRGKDYPSGHDPTVVVTPDGAGCTYVVRHEPFEQSPRGPS